LTTDGTSCNRGTVNEALHQAGGCPQGQLSLAAATRSGQGHQPQLEFQLFEHGFYNQISISDNIGRLVLATR
jgi:hypothetical protein